MVNKLLSLIVLFMLLAFNGHVAFAYDAELAESSKCSRYFAAYEDTFHMPSNLIKAVAITESGKYVKSARKSMAWPWTVNAQGKGYHYASKREAIRAVSEFRAKGIKSIDVGCMQVNLMYHPEAFHNLEQAFEPRYNIGYAAQFLRDKFTQARNWQAAVGLYHSGVAELSRDYIKQVYSVWRIEDKSMQQVASLDRLEIEVFDAPGISNKDVSGITKDALAILRRN